MDSNKQKVYKHSEYFGNIFKHMRSNEKYCDCIIKTRDGENIKVHKAVLASVSPYFDALLNAGLREKKESVVTFPEIDSGILRQIIDYIYTSEITINNNDNALSLLFVSRNLHIQWILDRCCDYLKETLNTANCLTTYRLADMFNGPPIFYCQLRIHFSLDLHSCEVLSEHCTDYMIQNFENFVADESFLNLSFEQLKDIISSDDLCVQREEILYGAVLTWVKNRVDYRNMYLTELMSHVRLPLIKTKNILQHFIEEPLMKTDSEFKDLLTKSVGDQLYPKDGCEPNIKLTQPRKSTTPSQLILIAGKTCQWYDSSWNDIPIPQMRNPRRSTCAVATNKNFYVFGGLFKNPSSVATGCGERFDTSLNKWTPMPDMPTSRFNFGAVALGHLIYASGGFLRVQGSTLSLPTSKVEIYNTEISEWEEGPPMDFDGYTKSVEVNNAIYCVDERKVCCFDPRTPVWTHLTNSNFYRDHFCLVSYKTYMYCIGGCENNSAVATVDWYDVRNVRNRKWKRLDNMKTGRCGHSAVLKNNMIYVFGGVKPYHDTFYEYTYETIPTVEMYDIQRDKWTQLDNMKIDCVTAGADILNID